MVDTNELKGIIAKNGLSQRRIAELIGMTEKKFYRRMKAKKFSSDEIEKMLLVIHIEDPIKIFFDPNVT